MPFVYAYMCRACGVRFTEDLLKIEASTFERRLKGKYDWEPMEYLRNINGLLYHMPREYKCGKRVTMKPKTTIYPELFNRIGDSRPRA